MYIHSAEEGVTLPPHLDGIFAVMRIKGLQYKVVRDDRVMCEQLPFEVGEQIQIDEVLMVGTKDYTCIGRPTVQKARVLASVEEISQTEKTLIFKKRRMMQFDWEDLLETY